MKKGDRDHEDRHTPARGPNHGATRAVAHTSHSAEADWPEHEFQADQEGPRRSFRRQQKTANVKGEKRRWPPKTLSDAACRAIAEAAIRRDDCESRLASLDPSARLERRTAQRELDRAAASLADLIAAAK